MCDEAVDGCLAALKFLPDGSITSKLLETFDNTLHSNDDMLFSNEDFDKASFIANQWYIIPVDLDKINLNNDNNLDENDPDTIIQVELLNGHSKFKKLKALKKGKA